MSFKEKMMENMMGKMTAEEKKDMMDKMMEGFFSTMTKEEKQEMMNSMMPKMMEQMMGGDGTADNSNMMMNMMPKMMEQMMMGGKTGNNNSGMSMMNSMMGGSSMMDMMSSMMGGDSRRKDEDLMNAMSDGGKSEDNKNESFQPMDMCKKMMSTISKSSDMATFATPEIRQLFEEWVQEVDIEILDYIKDNNTADPDIIAEHLKISKDSVMYFLNRLAQRGKLSIKVELNNMKA